MDAAPTVAVIARHRTAVRLLAVALAVAVAPPLLAQRAAAPTSVVAPSCAALRGAPVAREPVPRLDWHAGPVAWAEWPVRLGTGKVPATLVVVRVDPSRVSLALEIAPTSEGLGPWRIQNAPADAVLAVNAGQFTDAGPWGWVVHRGREWQAPGSGALAAAVVVDSGGAVRVIGAADIAAARAKGGLVEVVQSYPHLLQQGVAPDALCTAGAIDATHRDARLAIGTAADGAVYVVLSRYRGVGAAMTERLPIGPTTLEMALLLRRLGVRDAVMLDGGLSAQLRLRGTWGDRQWSGLRSVPLAIVGRLRELR